MVTVIINTKQNFVVSEQRADPQWPTNSDFSQSGGDWSASLHATTGERSSPVCGFGGSLREAPSLSIPPTICRSAEEVQSGSTLPFSGILGDLVI